MFPRHLSPAIVTNVKIQLAGILLALAAAIPPLPAATLYWDTNGDTPGAGNPANGTWNSANTLWSTSSAGDVTTSAYTAGSDVVFSAGSDAATAAVAVSGNQSAASLTFRSGSVSLTGSEINSLAAITVESGAGTITVGNNLKLVTGATINTNGNLTGGAIIGGGAFSKNGTGTLSLNSLDGILTINAGMISVAGGNKIKDVTINDGGTLRVGTNAVIDGRSISVASGGTFELIAGATETIGRLSGDGSAVLGAGAILTVGSNNPVSFSGVISGAGSLAKNGTATFTLSGVNTYTGNTVVNAGGVSLSDNASLQFVIGADGVNNGISGAGILNVDGDFVFDLTNAAAAGTWNIVDVNSLSETFGITFSVVGWTDNLDDTWSFAQGDSLYTFSEATGLLTAVPEPSAALLMGLGCAVVCFRRRRGQS